jgi:hypothetical protein
MSRSVTGCTSRTFAIAPFVPFVSNAQQISSHDIRSVIVPCLRPLQSRQRRSDASARAYLRSQDEADIDSGKEFQIEGLNRDYCSDFVCTSSPLIEQTVKALARDLIRQTTWTFSLFTPGVRYQVCPLLNSTKLHNSCVVVSIISERPHAY